MQDIYTEPAPPHRNWRKVFTLYLTEFGLFIVGLYLVYFLFLETPFTGFLNEHDFKV